MWSFSLFLFVFWMVNENHLKWNLPITCESHGVYPEKLNVQTIDTVHFHMSENCYHPWYGFSNPHIKVLPTLLLVKCCSQTFCSILLWSMVLYWDLFLFCCIVNCKCLSRTTTRLCLDLVCALLVCISM